MHSKLFDLLALCISKKFSFNFGQSTNTIHVYKIVHVGEGDWVYLYGDLTQPDQGHTHISLDHDRADAHIQRMIDELAAWIN